MKATSTLGILLIISVGLNAYLYHELREPSEEGVPVQATCYDTPGYGPAANISNAEAGKFANQYQDSAAVRKDTILGGIISRAAFDSILCKKDCNAITYRFARDASGGIIGKESVFIIFSGANVSLNTNGTYDVNDLGIEKYIPRHWCPPSCMKFD